MRFVLAYLGAGLTMALLDAVWLTLASGRLYRPVIGSLMADKPDLRPAVAFYLIYLGGIVFFAVAPGLKADSLVKTATAGAVLGLVAYATYDLTNQATLKVWATHITLIDMAWGAFLTATAAVAGHLLARRFS